MQKIYINTITRQWFDTDGSLFGSGSPQLAYKRTEEIALQLCSETPYAGTGGVNPETDWTKDASFGVGGIGAKLSIDNDFLRRRKGTLSAAIPAGTVSTVTAAIEGASKATIRTSGILKVFDADGNAEALEYESASFSGNSVTFTLKSGSEVENSYAQGAEMDVPDALYAQAMMDSEKSDAAAGLFVFNIVVYSEKLRAVMEYANIANLDTLAGMELLLFKTSGDTITELNNFLCTTVSLHATMAEANTLAQVPPSMTDELVSLITSTLGNVEYEYSEDGTNWHSTRTDADNYFRFKLTGSGSSGTWITANMKNGITPHIGENGNWYIGDTDTEIPAVGGNGITPHIGQNGNWYDANGDTGVKAELSGSYIEFSAVDASGNFTFAGTTTVPTAVLTNAGHFYPVEKGSVIVNLTNNTTTLNVAPYLAYDDAASFSGTWRLYMAAGYPNTGTDQQNSSEAPIEIEATKFEVYATDAVIPAGTVDADTGLAYAADVPAGMSHYFKLRTDTLQADQDVSVDWGDGTTSVLKNGDFDSLDTSEWESAGECVYALHHTYSTPGKYIVTINGKSYWGIQTGPFTNGGVSILSRMFAADLPMASCVANLASCCANSPKLQKVLIPTGMDLFVNIHNASSIFSGCFNLLSATNFATKFQYTRYVQNMFKGCRNMVTCDFRIPQNCIKSNAYKSVFEGCAALTANIANLLPERGFDGVNLDISRCFYGCASLTGTVPAAILWNDMRVVWTHANTFTGCPAAILAQVPESWGGTAAEVEDPHPITRSQVTAVIGSKVDEAVQNISIPASGGTGNILGGYAVKATAYNAATYTLTLDPGEEGDETDMDKFIPGTMAYVNECSDDIEEDAENNIAEVWGTYKHAEIASVDAANHTITFTEDIGLDTSTELENIFCRVADASRKDAAASSGDRNFVTGEAASADGLLNTVTGIGSKAEGSMNTVIGHFSGAQGVNNVVSGNRSFASGGNNKVSADMAEAIGNGNEIEGQGAIVLGGGNNAVTGVDVKILGDGNKASGARANLIGFHNEVSGNDSTVIGSGLKNAAKKAVMIGSNGELADTPENQGAVAIAGGDTSDGTEEISFIHRSRKVNPLDAEETEPAFSHEYRGRLIPMTLQIAEVGTIALDHDQYARWELTGTGAVTLTLANWENGDRGEVVIDTTKQTLSIPAAWVVKAGTENSWTATPGFFLLEIMRENNTIFLHNKLPF